MAEYKRKKRVRPVLLKKSLPDCAKEYENYYVGLNDEKQFVFEFPYPYLANEFLGKVGGMPIDSRTVVLSTQLAEAVEGAKKLTGWGPPPELPLPTNEDDFKELEKFLQDLFERKKPYLEALGVTKNELTGFQLLWERNFWRDKYFKEKNRAL